MSTVLETIVARALHCQVVAFSLITNVHNGGTTSHTDVLAAAARGADSVARLIEGIVANLEPAAVASV
jgi:purine nucleoside phosphorylase